VRREQAEKKCAPDIKAAPVAPTPAKGTQPRRKRATP
jgi:hypothetical protein